MIKKWICWPSFDCAIKIPPFFMTHGERFDLFVDVPNLLRYIIKLLLGHWLNYAHIHTFILYIGTKLWYLAVNIYRLLGNSTQSKIICAAIVVAFLIQLSPSICIHPSFIIISLVPWGGKMKHEMWLRSKWYIHSTWSTNRSFSLNFYNLVTFIPINFT